jgi:hypothetical protein
MSNNDPRIDKLNAEIREHEDWLGDKTNHHAHDRLQVQLSLVSKTLKRDELLKTQLQNIANKEHEI